MDKRQEKAMKGMKQIMRLAETNVDGSLPVRKSILKIRGVGYMMANAISHVSGFGDKILAELSEKDQKTLEDMILNPHKHNIPSWMYNRRKDPATGEDKHIAVSTLQLAKKMDIDGMKKIRSYKGVRHSHGLPVRGQRTRSSFRKGKTVGVSKKKATK